VVEEKKIPGDPEGLWREQDQHHQGRSRSHFARPEGSQGPGRWRPAIKENATKDEAEAIARSSKASRPSKSSSSSQAGSILAAAVRESGPVLHRVIANGNLQARSGRAKIFFARLPAHPGYSREWSGLADASVRKAEWHKHSWPGQSQALWQRLQYCGQVP